MIQNMLAIERLQELPLSERREGLEELVVTEFRTTLMMTDEEDLPFDMSYFDLGFTSLRITEIKERLATSSAAGLAPTCCLTAQLWNVSYPHLADEVLADLFGSLAAT